MSETTPLTSGVKATNGTSANPFGGLFASTEEARALFNQLPSNLEHSTQSCPPPTLTREQVDQASDVLKAKYEELQRSIQERDLGIRILGVIAGALLLVTSFFGFFGHIFAFQLRKALIELVECFMGILMLVLESRQLQLPDTYQRDVYKYAYFLKFAWGRGTLYICVGAMELILGSFTDWIIGLLIFATGVWYIVVSRQTAKKLIELREALQSEQVLREKFDEIDVDGKGRITLDQFRDLTISLGITEWKRHECEAAFLYIDSARYDVSSETITYDDFRAWWLDWQANPSRASDAESFFIV